MKSKIGLEIIHWVDSKIELGEVETIERHGYATISSVGYVIYENTLVVTLAQDYRGDEDTYRTTITIPKCCVIDRLKLLIEEYEK